MTYWQRRLRFALAVFGLALAVVVFLAIQRRAPAAAPAGPTRLDPAAQTEIATGVIQSTKGSKNNFKIEFEHAFGYANGVQKFRGVIVNVDERGGRSFVLTAQDAEVGANNAWVNVAGDVKLAVSDGLTAQTDQASWSEGEEIIRSPGKVTFARGRMKGSGVGMTYDKTRDVLWLLDQAEVTLAPDETGKGTLSINAGAAGFARPDKYMKFERGVKMVRDGKIIEADEATAHLSEDEKHVTALELRGNSRIIPERGGPGTLEQLSAADMNLGYAPDSEILQTAILSGQSAIQLGGESGGRGSRIAADAIDLTLGPDGTTLTVLTARDNVQTDFAAGRDQPARVVRSVSLDGRGEPGKGLTAATFTDSVEYRETIPGRPPVQRTVRARVLEAILNPATAAIEEGKFSGAVRFEEGQMSASAANARYRVTGGTVDLSGLEGTERPVVADEQIRIEASAIQFTPEGPRMTASTDVRSTLQSAKKKAAGAAETRMPGMLAQEEPVSVTGDHLEYDGEKSTAVYTGNARLWQGDTSINGDTLALDNSKGDLTVTGSVRTLWSAPGAEGPGAGGRASGSEKPGSGIAAAGSEKPRTGAQSPNPGARTPEPGARSAAPGASPQPPAPSPQPPARVQTLATSEDMRYEDALRRATYTGKAHVVGPQGDVTGAKIELYLAKDNNDLDRVEAYEKVTVKIDRRTSTGGRMTYFAADERYVMSGAPVQIVDECGTVTTARTLVFYKSTDTIVVNGVESRAQTKKTGGKCP